MTPERVAALLAERAAWTYSRSSGAGGQRRDHAETRAELTVRLADLDGLPGLTEAFRSGSVTVYALDPAAVGSQPEGG